MRSKKRKSISGEAKRVSRIDGVQSVSFEDCFSELVERGGPAARNAYDAWRRRPGYEHVVEFVERFRHEKLFEITTQDVIETIRETEHALGDVPKEAQIREIEDFTCPFALQHIFHRFIEGTGDIPTWQRFWRWMERQARPHWLDKIEPLRENLLSQYDQKRIDDAIRWRLGKFYYSAIREVDLLITLREKGVDLKYHILADVLLRVDFWTGSTLVCTYFPNKRYREGQGGRKPPAEQFFAGSRAPFNVVDFEIDRQGFGRTWLVSDAAKDRLAQLLRQST